MPSNTTLPKLPVRLELQETVSTDTFRFFVSDEEHPAHRYQAVDPDGQVWGFVVVDNTERGPGLGGIRIAPDLTLNEVARLARAMTLKNSAACLPYGGGKAGLIHDPVFLHNNPEYKNELILKFAEALFPLESYIPAPDMGTNDHDAQQIYNYFSERLGTREHRRGGASRLPETGGIPIDDWGLTAHGLYAAIRILETFFEDFQIAGSRVVIQGFGNVGHPVAQKLLAEGACIAGVSDISQGLYHSSGLNMDALESAVQKGGLVHYAIDAEYRFPAEQLDRLLEAPCDILIPAARPDAITARNADRIDCRRVIQGANAPANRLTEYYLENRRGIVNYADFIVNVGGVMGCAVELEMTVDPAYREKVLSAGNSGRSYVENLIYNTVSNNVRWILEHRSEFAQDATFREIALTLAGERLKTPELTWL